MPSVPLIIEEWVQPLWRRPEHLVPTPGFCIYCGSQVHLEDEHILPLSLNGTLIYQKASCRRCAHTINRYEQQAIKHLYGSARFSLKMSTRRTEKQRPKTQKMDVISDGVKKSIDVHLDDYPPFFIPEFILGTPQFLLGSNPIPNIPYQLRLNSINSPNKKFKEWGFEFGFKDNFLFQTLAKIAHGFACAAYGPENFEHWLKPMILEGMGDCPMFLVGSEDEPCPHESVLHCMRLYEAERMIVRRSGVIFQHDRLLIAKIWLFAKWTKICYVVVVGKITKSKHLLSSIAFTDKITSVPPWAGQAL